MARKVAVIVRDRQHEALRMSVGLTIGDNAVSVFVMDKELVFDENTKLNIEALRDMGAKIFSNIPENGFAEMSIGEIARALLEYDIVIPY
ncbi:MAG: hypothetical protein M1510_00850 [Nitrospirae bacterium]|nr:hypothetical protein [Nitrospirota bacterium]